MNLNLYLRRIKMCSLHDDLEIIKFKTISALDVGVIPRH